MVIKLRDGSSTARETGGKQLQTRAKEGQHARFCGRRNITARGTDKSLGARETGTDRTTPNACGLRQSSARKRALLREYIGSKEEIETCVWRALSEGMASMFKYKSVEGGQESARKLDCCQTTDVCSARSHVNKLHGACFKLFHVCSPCTVKLDRLIDVYLLRQ
eukprot:2279237-Pleurochrysis_carterae.AAC.2